MSKKLIAACMALAAFVAFAVVPAVASASPQLTQPTGTKMATGTLVQATTVETKPKFVSTTGSTLVECDTAFMTGTLFENSGTSIKGGITKAEFHNTGGTPCSSPFGGSTTVTTNVGNGTPWCVQSTKEDNFEVRGGDCNEASRSITFVLDTATAGVCKYNSSVNPTGTFATEPSDAILRASNSGLFKKEEGGLLCPAEGKLTMNFTLETDPGAEPIYIS